MLKKKKCKSPDRKITKNGLFPNMTCATGNWNESKQNTLYLDERGHHYDVSSANAHMNRGKKIGKYSWTKNGYRLDKKREDY